MSYGGLRGAVAFALVLVVNENIIPTKKMMVTTIIAIVYFTVFLQGKCPRPEFQMPISASRPTFYRLMVTDPILQLHLNDMTIH